MIVHFNIGRIIVSSKVNYESLASVMPRNEQETDAVVDPVIAEMNARPRLNLQLRMNIPPVATRLFLCR